MIELDRLASQVAGSGLEAWIEELQGKLGSIFDPARHGSFGQWLRTLENLPAIETGSVRLDADTVSVGDEQSCSAETRNRIEESLREFHPWRKGPYRIHGIGIDTEWRSDWKWQRVAPHISPLQGRRVLDVGCGNGYHCWRMAGAGASLVIGIDPLLLNVVQFLAIRHFLGPENAVHVLPLGIEDLPQELHSFDTVFSMGVLYHRRSPIDHLNELAGALRPGGELVLETLVVEGDAQTVLVPPGRYAKMRNVWFIPSCAALEVWLARCGYRNIRVVDVTRTTSEEQRSTDWMRFNSLPDFLDSENSELTAEGHPSPLRATVIAEVPG